MATSIHGEAIKQLEEGAFVPLAPAETPFFENSRLMVVAIRQSDSFLVYKAQTEPNGPYQNDFTPICTTTAYNQLAGGSTMDGRVAVAAQAQPDKAVHFFVESASSSGGTESWESPVDLGLPPSVTAFERLLIGRGADGGVEIFGINGHDGHVWWIFQNPPRTVTRTIEVTPPGSDHPITITVEEPAPPLKPWSDWQELPPVSLNQLKLANNADGRLALLGASGIQGELWFTQQEAVQALTPQDWDAWQKLDAPVADLTAPVLALDTGGSLNAFGIGGGKPEVLQKRQFPPGDASFGPWVRPFLIDNVLVQLTAGLDGDNDVVLVALDENKNLYANVLRNGDIQDWSGWGHIGVSPGFGEMRMDYNADGRLTLFVWDGESANLSIISQAAFDSTSWEAFWTPLSTEGIVQFDVVRDLTPPATP